MADMNAKIAAHRLRSIADAIQNGDVKRILSDPSYGLTPELRECLEQLLTARVLNK
jgi:hypothetical protein